MKFLIAAFSLCLLVTAAQAQSYTQTARSFVPSPQALGMGDSGVAFSTEQTVFFYNPAHLAQVASPRPRLTFLGVRGSASGNVFDQVAFLRDEMKPAFEEGIENLPADELEGLYDEAYALGRRRTTATVDVMLPAVLVRVGAVGVGAGLFAHSQVRYHVEDGGGGAPVVDAVGMADAIGVASLGLDASRFGLRGLSVGLTAKYTRRYLSVKAKPVDGHTWSEADGYTEPYHLLRGGSAGVDAGLLYQLPLFAGPGRLQVGLAFYDLVASDFNYAHDRTLFNEDAATPENVASDEALANARYALHSSHRLGVAYMLPRLGGLFKETGVALDYVGYARPAIEQAFAARLRMGAQTVLARFLALRAGLGQGYTSLGAGLHFPFVHLDYDFYGVEEGRLPGQLPSWNHTVQVKLGLF